jgi:hypothetical protein
MYTYARPAGPNIVAFRRVIPRLAWHAGSRRLKYASVSTMIPPHTPAEVSLTSRLPNKSLATTAGSLK